VATILTYPFITIKTRLQILKEQSSSYSGTWASLTSVIKNEGFFGLYKGLNSKILQSVLTSALLFMMKEKLVSYTLGFLGLFIWIQGTETKTHLFFRNIRLMFS